jgi:hypothetical protein
MKYLRLLWSFPLFAGLAACGGSGSSAPAPTNFQVTPQDAQLYMTWDATPGVEYQVFCDPNQATINSHTTGNGRIYFYGIRSGTFYAAGLDTRGWSTGITNGVSYACTVNGRIGTGAGGPDATPQVASPRLAGASWSAGATATLSGMTVRSVAYGLLTAQSTTSDQFVAVGAGGQIAVSAAVSADAQQAWAAPSQAAGVTNDLNSVAFYPYAGGYRFVAVGAGGKVAYATNSATWTWIASTMPSTNDMYAVAVAGGGTLVAVGDGGAIAYSGDGVSWAPATNNASSNPLRAVTYVDAGANSAAYWLAVGDGGTILKSVDGGLNWNLLTSGVGNNLQGVAALPIVDSVTQTTTYKLVAIGNGVVLVSGDDGSHWASATLSDTMGTVLSGNFVSVSAAKRQFSNVYFKGQFMAVDNAGNAYTSANGSTWTNNGPTGAGSSAATVIRYTPSMTAVSNGWMVFSSSGSQYLAK